ncbi:hypothetical protein EDC01DRAFT_621995 [Geopyxis carbonaria]|nr:hypothetical protein EDC01DRAFT_621995 [Geopyxis carbonaria]
MRELAPSPVDDDFPDYTFPSPPSSPGSNSFPTPTSSGILPAPTFSSSSTFPTTRGPAYYLHRTQKYSSYAFLTFLLIHGSTAAATPLLLGVPAGNSALLLARTYFYQATPLVEAVLIPGALAVHVASGLGLRAYRGAQQRQRYGGSVPASIGVWRWRNISAISKAGIIAVPAVAAHAGLLRVLPLLVDGDSSNVTLEYLAHGFWRGKWAGVVGGVFYAGFVGAVSFHVVYGLAQWWKVSARRRKGVAAAAVGVAVVWLGGLGRVVGAGKQGGYIGRHYEKLYRVFFGRIEAA